MQSHKKINPKKINFSAGSSKGDKYNLHEKPFARGSYSNVYRAEKKGTEEVVVVKVITEKTFEDLVDLYRILREIIILKLLKGHPNITSLIDIIHPKESQNTYKSLLMVFEKMDGSLRQVFSTNETLIDRDIQCLFFQLLIGVRYIHSQGILHRDLKPGNVLTRSDWHLEICDFNLSRAIGACPEATNEQKQNDADSDSIPDTPPPFFRQLTQNVVSLWYRAPEILMNAKDYDAASDMWSVGCILAELLMMQTDKAKRAPLFQGENDRDQLECIMNFLGTPTEEDLNALRPRNYYSCSLQSKKPVDIKQHFSYVEDKNAIDLLSKLLVYNPNKRLTAEQALNHPFLSNSDYFMTRSMKKDLDKKNPVNRELRAEYDQFETLLEKEKGYEVKKRTINSNTIRKCIWNEMKEYHPLPKTKRQLHCYLLTQGYFANNKALRKESFNKACATESSKSSYQRFVNNKVRV